MKKCAYCGKENPDDATVCMIDQRPLAPEDKSNAPAGLSQEEVRAHMAVQPLAVKFAVSLLAFGGIFDLALLIFKYQSSGARSRNFYLLTAFTFGMVAVFLYLVFRGKNWARWVVICSITFGILAGPFMRIGPPHWNTYFFTFIDVVAVGALLQRSSNEWYRGTKTISSPRLPAS